MKARVASVLNLGLFCCLLFVTAAGAAAEQKEQAVQTPHEVAELLAKIGKKVSGFNTLKTDFVQEKELALFQDKLVLKGRIYLQKPNKIAWHVDQPVRYSVLITEKLIRQWDAETNKVQEVSLAKNPVFQSVLGQLTIWFSGEYAALLKDYDVRVVGNKPVTVECFPKDTSITRKIIRNITLVFREDQTYLQQIRILEQTGDATTINFLNTVLNAPLDSGNFEVRRAKEQGSRSMRENTAARSAQSFNSDHNREARIFR